MMNTAQGAPFRGAYKASRVLVTGHTGFKGSWLALWLGELGAEVAGYSLEPPTVPSNFEATRLADRMAHHSGDVRDFESLQRFFRAYEPRVVFHLAAQSLVRRSYREPSLTFATNALGTVNVLEAARTTASVKSLVIVTSDKCYEERGGRKGYSEEDRLGGGDPYSASKGMAELAVRSYLRSFFSAEGGAAPEESALGLASARAGNVIGGGDFGEDRLVPDCMRAFAAGKPVTIRNPASIRPWQFVLEPLSGYLLLGARLLEDGPGFSGAWNFGPSRGRDVPTAELVEKIIHGFGGGSWERAGVQDGPREADRLRLSCAKAARMLNWRAVYGLEKTLSETLEWYKTFNAGGGESRMYDVCTAQIRRYVRAAQKKGLDWA